MGDMVIPDMMNDVFLPQGSFVLISVLEWKCVRKGGSRWGYLEDFGVFLRGNLEDGVVLEVMDDLGRVQGSCCEGFVALSLFLSEI